MIKPYDNDLKKRRNKIKLNKHYRSYIKRNKNNNIVAVYCKGCGEVIKLLDESGQLYELGNYIEMIIEFPDNSAHSTPMCKSCVNSKTKDDLEALYISDLDELDKEEDIQPSNNNNIWDKVYLARVPEGIAKKEKIRNVS